MTASFCRTRRQLLQCLGVLAAPALGACSGTQAGAATIAVATNFMPVAENLAASFRERTGLPLQLVGGSTGQLYAQIVNGAPFDALLAADEERPRKLVDGGLALAASYRVYATGQLALWSRDPRFFDGEESAALAGASYRHLALANPALAPYGAAARDVLQELDLWEPLSTRIVLAENVGQVYALVATGNAEAGFVALSSLVDAGSLQRGWRWDVPPKLHRPVHQAAVLLQRGRDRQAAREFLDHLALPAVRRVIARSGYTVTA